MKDWYDKYGKWIIPILTFIGGLAIGIYKTTLDYQSRIDVLEANLKMEINDAVHDIENLIQNRVLTTIKK